MDDNLVAGGHLRGLGHQNPRRQTDVDQRKIQKGQQDQGPQHRPPGAAGISGGQHPDHILGIGRQPQPPAPEHGHADQGRVAVVEQGEQVLGGVRAGQRPRLYIELRKTAHPADHQPQQHYETEHQQNQIKGVCTQHGAVSAKGGVQHKQVYHQHRHRIRNVKERGGHRPKALVLRHQIADIYHHHDSPIDHLEGR